MPATIGATTSPPPTPTVAVGAVITDDAGRLLAVKRGRPPAVGRWSLPGGKVESGERLADAVAREVVEETGLHVEVDGLVGHLEFLDEDHHYVILDFRAHLRDDFRAHRRDDFRAHLRDDFRAHLRDRSYTPRPGDDVTDARWLTRSQLEALPITEGLLDFLDGHGVELAP